MIKTSGKLNCVKIKTSICKTVSDSEIVSFQTNMNIVLFDSYCGEAIANAGLGGG